MDRDQVVLSEKEADVDGIEVVRVIRGLAKRDGANDEEHVPVELLELDPGLRVYDLFDCQRMKVEDVLEHRDLVTIAGVDVHPQCAFSRSKGTLDLLAGQLLPH